MNITLGFRARAKSVNNNYRRLEFPAGFSSWCGTSCSPLVVPTGESHFSYVFVPISDGGHGTVIPSATRRNKTGMGTSSVDKCTTNSSSSNAQTCSDDDRLRLDRSRRGAHNERPAGKINLLHVLRLKHPPPPRRLVPHAVHQVRTGNACGETRKVVDLAAGSERGEASACATRRLTYQPVGALDANSKHAHMMCVSLLPLLVSIQLVDRLLRRTVDFSKNT